MKTWGIILAAGSGTRMGAPKALLPLRGKPMLYYSLQAFTESTRIDAVGLVCRAGDVEIVRAEASCFPQKVRFVVPGGKERQDSVFEGMKALPPEAEWAAVHDCARPLVTAAEIDAVIKAAEVSGAALLAVPVKDTVKISENGTVRETPDRKKLWAAQTPQAFKAEILRRALEKAKQDGFFGTDCSGIVERLGVAVRLVEGSPRNIKVTDPSDIAAAESLLKAAVK